VQQEEDQNKEIHFAHGRGSALAAAARGSRARGAVTTKKWY